MTISCWIEIPIILERPAPDRCQGRKELNAARLIQRLHFRIVPDTIIRALELRKGTADISGVNSLTPDLVVALAKAAGYRYGRTAREPLFNISP